MGRIYKLKGEENIIMNTKRTAESVTPKHPDKMCDQISDAILDWYLHHDEYARVAVEVLGGHGKVYVCGEVTANAPKIEEAPDAQAYSPLQTIIKGITEKELAIEVNIVQQSNEIANGVDTGGAGDQGIMKGYAVNDTHNYLPMEYELARSLCQFLYEQFPYDGKTQITLNEYGEIDTIVASFQNVEKKVLETAVFEWLTNKVAGIIKHSNPFKLHCNPAGDWAQGGFDADTGLTGRKLMVDNYGPRYAIGGGAFSGKDATKVDRSGAYMARKIAVDLLKEYEAHEVAVEIAYAIGVAEPVSVSAMIKRFGFDEAEKIEVPRDRYDLTPKGIIDTLGLRKPQYQSTAEWGHFGRGFKWD